MIVEKVIQKVDERYMIDTLQRMIRDAPTINPADPDDPGDYGPIKEFLLEEFSALGLNTQALGRPDVPNIVGRLKGKRRRPALIMAGHIDTVPVGDESKWVHPPFAGEVHNGKLYGRGALDDRSGIVAAMGAIKAMGESGQQLEGDLVLVGYSDSEAGGGRGIRVLAEKHTEAIRADWGVGLEPTFLKIPVCAKGVLWLTITTGGLAGHAGGVFLDEAHGEGVPINAVEKMAKILVPMIDVDRWMKYRPNPYFGPGSGHYTSKPTVQVGGRFMVGNGVGDRVNIVPDLCRCEADIRTLPGQTGELVVSELRALINELKKQDPQINAKVEPFNCLDPWEISPDSPLIKTIAECATSVLGAGPKLIGHGMTTPYRYFAPLMPIAHFGCAGESMHGSDECVHIDSLVKCSKIYAMIALQFLT